MIYRPLVTGRVDDTLWKFAEELIHGLRRCVPGVHGYEDDLNIYGGIVEEANRTSDVSEPQRTDIRAARISKIYKHAAVAKIRCRGRAPAGIG